MENDRIIAINKDIFIDMKSFDNVIYYIGCIAFLVMNKKIYVTKNNTHIH